MRLTVEQVHALRLALERRFGPDARLRLFGSRLDDAARGGDCDVMVQSDDADADRLVDARLAFLADLHATPAFDGERNDVVLRSTALHHEPLPIQALALQGALELT